jgi:uncharacterized protein (TIGR02679 family)
MSPVWCAIRDRLESRGLDNRGRIQLPSLSSDARLTLTGLLGRKPTSMLDLVVVEVALVDLGVGADLVVALGNLGFAPSPGPAARRAARAERESARSAARAAVDSWSEPWATAWIDDVVRAGLLRGLDAPAATTLVLSARSILDRLDTASADRSISRTDLAATVLGSSHALDTGTALETVVARALAHRMDQELIEGAWERAGVHTDQVSGAVLTWALPTLPESGLHELSAAATKAGVPLHLTRYALATHPVQVAAGTTILVAENPRVVEAAAQRSSARATLTTNGNPSAAVRLLLDQLLTCGATLLYHGDFDVPGLAICARMQQIGLVPWRMDAAHYRAAVEAAAAAGIQLPIEDRPPGPTPWDPPLQNAMQETGRVVHEERLLEDVLE